MVFNEVLHFFYKYILFNIDLQTDKAFVSLLANNLVI